MRREDEDFKFAQAWKEEIRRRIADLKSGKAKTVPWEEVRKRIQARLTTVKPSGSD
jgi:putative addiction module component (TIGR02574 family)